MCNVIIPTNTVPSPTAFIPIDPELLTSINESNARDYAGTDAGGDVPSPLGNGNGSNPVAQYIEPGTPPTGGGFPELLAFLDEQIKVGADAWKEYGASPPNPRVGDCFQAAGLSANTKDGGKQGTPWCACFVTFALQQSGLPLLRTASSQAYKRYGSEIAWTSWENVRLNDIIVLTNMSETDKGHVGFFRGYNPSTSSILMLGGNQSDTLKVSTFAVRGKTLAVTSVKRNWSVPAEYDKPLFVDNTGAPTDYSATR